MRFQAVAVFLLVAGCQQPEKTPTTIRPAETTPAPPSPSTQTLGEEPIITTTGSPRPFDNRRLQFEPVVIREGDITVRSPLPVMNTAFRLMNRGSQPHEITLRPVGGESLIRPARIEPGGVMIAEVLLTQPQYELACVIEGHDEVAPFKTYVPR